MKFITNSNNIFTINTPMEVAIPVGTSIEDAFPVDTLWKVHCLIDTSISRWYVYRKCISLLQIKNEYGTTKSKRVP